MFFFTKTVFLKLNNSIFLYLAYFYPKNSWKITDQPSLLYLNSSTAKENLNNVGQEIKTGIKMNSAVWITTFTLLYSVTPVNNKVT